MTNTKNQKRLQQLSQATAILRKVHEDVRKSGQLTLREMAGLDAELNDLMVALKALQSACFEPRVMNIGHSTIIQHGVV